MLGAKRKNEAGKGDSGVLLETGWGRKASVVGRRASRNLKGASKHVRRYLRGNHRGQRLASSRNSKETSVVTKVGENIRDHRGLEQGQGQPQGENVFLCF